MRTAVLAGSSVRKVQTERFGKEVEKEGCKQCFAVKFNFRHRTKSNHVS